MIGIGNGGGKHCCGNQPPYWRYGPDTEFCIDPTELQNILSKREADTEFQYQPHIIDTDTIADAVFADAVFAEAISETSIAWLEWPFSANRTLSIF